jgi:hypothetical protein
MSYRNYCLAILLSLFVVAKSNQLEETFNPRTAPKSPLAFDYGDLHGRVQIKFKPETFMAKNSNLLNSANPSDSLGFNRSTIDLSVNLLWRNVTEFFATLRNKATWGNAETIAQTTETEVKLLESVFGAHRHSITRQIFWLREGWLKFSINEAFSLFRHPHYFTLGYFPFELGRGIALGSAFAVNPRFLGFFSDNVIDQYAPGFKWTGELPNNFSYDLYGEIAENRSDTFGNTTLKVRGQEFGHRFNQERGPGRINYIIAARARWIPKADKNFLVSFEPYVLYNNAPAQTVEFFEDAASELGTFGMAGEFVFGDFEWGFDAAKNVGHQDVRGWDRNKIEFENRGGAAVLVNSQVVTEDPNLVSRPPKVLYDPNSTEGRVIQEIINTSVQNATQNGQLIGTVGATQLYNGLFRFRNPHRNVYQGWMVVTDAAYWLHKRDFKVAAMVGAASGDKNPNQNIDDPNSVRFDGNFKGFIGLQEIYSGNRVQSAFFLGGAGRIPRPLVIPLPGEGVDELPTAINGFTNLIFVGLAAHWYPKICGRSWSIRPNVLTYWQEHATNKFDLTTQMSSTQNARNFFGTEVNAFIDVDLMRDLKLYIVASTFIPGDHYRDIRGTPLSREQQKLLDRLDVTGVDADRLPLLGTDNAYTLNIGLEYRY